MTGFIIKSTDDGYVTYWAYGINWVDSPREATAFATKGAARAHIEFNNWQNMRQLVGHLDIIPATEV